jgi:hypothetical protein
LIVAIGLRTVGLSDTFESCANNYGISVSSSKCVFDLLLIGIDYKETCRAMITIFAQGKDKLRDLAQRWINVSICPQGLFWGHIGALDGWFPWMETPRSVSNKADYFSKHYKAHGQNIQAMCDPDLLFVCVALASRGMNNDACAFNRCMGLIDWFKSLPDWCFVSKDNTYSLTQKMLVPHNETKLWSDSHTAFIFFLSQLRIRIEMAFGRLTTKWRRLQTTMKFTPAKNAKIICECTKLHNYVICKSKEAGSSHGTVKLFENDVVDPCCYGIEQLQGDSPNGNRDFGFLVTQSNFDKQILFSTTEMNSSHRDSIVAD